MGCVYAASTRDGERVALKLVKAELASDNSFRRRFDREARYAARLAPQCRRGRRCRCPEWDPVPGRRFVVGRSLDEVINEDGPLPLATAVRLCAQIAEALDAIHAGDRPQGPQARERDAGRAKRCADHRFRPRKASNASLLTMPGQAVGSLDYMAPEQVRGDEVSAASDVYALGCLMFTCRAGLRSPIARGSRSSGRTSRTSRRIRARSARTPGPWQVITSALAKDPWTAPTASDARGSGGRAPAPG